MRLLTTLTIISVFISACILNGCKEDAGEPVPVFTIPKLTDVENVTDTSFKFNWTFPVSNTGFIYQVSSQFDFTNAITGEVSSATYEVEGLEPVTTYYIRAKALYNGGESEFSAIDSVRTLVAINKITLITSDSYHLAAGISYPETEFTLNPAVILLHQVASSKEEWHGLEIYEMLNQNGYITMIFDHRNHGESDINPEYTSTDIISDPDLIPVDLQAAVAFLKNDPKVDPERVALIGASMGANLACVGNGNPELGIKTGISLSPRKTRVEELSAKIDDFTLSSMYFIVGENDSDLEQQTIDLYGQTALPRQLDVIEGSNSHGTQILVDFPDFNTQILKWLRENL